MERAAHYADYVLVIALVLGCLSVVPAALYFGVNWWLARSGGGIDDLHAGFPTLVLAVGGMGLYVGTRALGDGMVVGMVVAVLGIALLAKGSRELKSRIVAVFG